MTDTRIDPVILGEAAHWLLQRQDGGLDAGQRARFAEWLARSHEHQRAWRRAERLLEKIGSVPPALLGPTLDRTEQFHASSRRSLLLGVATLLAVSPVAWMTWRERRWLDWLGADYVAGIGEQRDVVLDDGSQVSLNTATLLDVRYDAGQRSLTLRRGEIYVSTATDDQRQPRPFEVFTDSGGMRALGTRFLVRRYDGQTLLAVYQGAVRIVPAQAGEAAAVTLQAGQQARFDARRVEAPARVSESSAAWRHGLLMADGMPLPQWVAELSRYSSQRIDFDPALRQLQLSGAFPVRDLEQALSMLEQTYRVKVERRGRRIRIGL